MLKLYCIRDVLVGFGVKHSYNPVIIDCPNDDVMIRVIKASLSSGAQPNELNVCPEDKEVWCIGSFDQETGNITPIKPYCVARCIDYKEVKVDVNSTTSGDASEATDKETL